ncbi:MAG: hypothetical protein O3A14_13925 [Cyanobacteria bacterium]|nr:hypothetical protein [Cyanobacteriota bacterium]
MTLGKRHFFAYRGQGWRTLGLASLVASGMVGAMAVADFGDHWAERGIIPTAVADL